MTGLESWMKQATRGLARESASQVQSEIQQHYQSAREAAIAGGATTAEAENAALSALGDAKTVNCQYRQVLLTSAEARVLREGNWEARAVCSRAWLKSAASAVPALVITVAGVLFLISHSPVARDVLICGIAMGLLFVAPFLPIYTPSRGRVFRLVKWAVATGTLVLLFGPETLRWSWLVASCLWPLAWTEWTRASIRRKLPVAAWPKHLYL